MCVRAYACLYYIIFFTFSTISCSLLLQVYVTKILYTDEFRPVEFLIAYFFLFFFLIVVYIFIQQYSYVHYTNKDTFTRLMTDYQIRTA